MPLEYSSPLTGDRHVRARPRGSSADGTTAGRWLILVASIGFSLLLLIQALHVAGTIAIGFDNWRPALYAYVLWAVALGVGLVMTRASAVIRRCSCFRRSSSPSRW